MTNVSAGFKRPWDGVEQDSHKRQKDREEPKDWRDVHLKSPKTNGPPPRRDSVDRRSFSDRGGRGRGDGDRRKTSDGGYKSRRDDRHHTRREDSKRDSKPRRSTPPRQPNEHSQPLKDDSEREEGE